MVKIEDNKKEDSASAKAAADKDFGLDLQKMTEAGLPFGHRTSRIHPKMKPYLSGTKNTTHIIDMEKSLEEFNKTLKFIKKIISEGKTLLFVGTKIQIKNLLRETAEECHLPYIDERWLGGTFTNFKTIKKRIDYFKELVEKRKKGELEKYTKKERAKIDKELEKLETKFRGIKNLQGLPDAIFVLDMKKDDLAIKEAKKKGIKIIAIADTNVDISLADYPIPANDDAISSVKYILEKVKDVIIKAKK